MPRRPDDLGVHRRLLRLRPAPSQVGSSDLRRHGDHTIRKRGLQLVRGAAKRDTGTLGVEPGHRRTARDGRARDWGPVATAPYRGTEKPATRGYIERLGLQIWSEALAGRDQASRASARAPIRVGCCLADCHLRRRLHPISRIFQSPSIPIPGTEKGGPAATLHKTAGGGASRNGEARRRAPARQSKANAGPGTLLTRVRVLLQLWVGVGGRCN